MMNEMHFVPLIREAAVSALAVARHDPPHDPPPGEGRVAAAIALPAARLMFEEEPDPDELAAALVPPLEDMGAAADGGGGGGGGGGGEGFPPVMDGHGHTRPLYAPLVVYTLLETFARHGHLLHEEDRGLCEACMGRACRPLRVIREMGGALRELEYAAAVGKPLPAADPRTTGEPVPEEFALTLWLAATQRLHAWLTGGDTAAADRVAGYIAAYFVDPVQSGKPSPLTPIGAGEALDGWTYRELAGLHALDILLRNAAGGAGPSPIQAAVARVAGYHAAHTQPDYTTYQPWGLPAFLRQRDTRTMAEQQLHDCRTHLEIEGGGAAVIAALLLTDAAVGVEGEGADGWGAGGEPMEQVPWAS